MSADFIKLIPEIHSRRYFAQIQKFIAKKTPCGLFYGFQIPENATTMFLSLKNLGLNMSYICVINDTCKSKIHRGGADIPIVTLEEFQNSSVKPSKMFYYGSDIFAKFFRRYGVETFLVVNPQGMEAIYNFYIQNLPKLYSTYELLTEEESRKVFLSYLKGRLSTEIRDYHFAQEPQYFLEGFLPEAGDIAIDGGAYNGTTARDFAMQGAKVFAFEMDEVNYRNCLERAEKFGFTIENLGLSLQEGEEFYGHGGAASSKGGGNLIGHFIDLDTYVLKKNLPRVDYIKLDIEGAELDMLHGAAKTISRWKPKMAISAYHKPEDLWTLATYVKSLRSDYEFKFRHYQVDGREDYLFDKAQLDTLKNFELDYLSPSHCELVLYCR